MPNCRSATGIAGLALVTGCMLGGHGDYAPPEQPARATPLPATPPAAGHGAAPELQEFARSLRNVPALDDLRLFTEARLAAAAGRDARAIAAATALIARHPDSAWAARARLLVGKVRRRTGELAEAHAALSTARDALPPGSAGWIQATLALAETAAQRGDGATAAQLANAIRDSRAAGIARRRARRLVNRVREDSPPPAGPDAVERQLAEADRLLAEDDPGAALATLEEAAATGAGWQGSLTLMRARTLRALGHRQAAEHALLAMANDPAETLAPRALATVARWRWNADDDATALRHFRAIVDRFPATPEAGDAWYAVGRIHQEAGRHQEASTAYAVVADRFPGTAIAAESAWRTGWCAYLGGDWLEAVERFEVLATSGPGAIRDAATYWEARALEQLGRPEASVHYRTIVERDPESYYAALATERLGPPAPLPPPTDVAAPAPVAFPTNVPSEHAERARLLLDLGRPSLARREVEALEPWVPDAVRMTAYAAVGAPGPALRAARRVSEPRDPAVRQHLYPLGFWDVIEPAARSQGLDPLLVAALVRQESLYFPDARSSADARGLMQLLPRTAREVARAAALPAPDASTLFRVAPNVDLGTRHLRHLLDRYGGSRVKALAAYNAGEDAVTRWEHRYGKRPADEFVELISYRETRDYVKAVLRHYQVYRALYATSPSATSVGSPPNAPLDMMAMTSPAEAVSTR